MDYSYEHLITALYIDNSFHPGNFISIGIWKGDGPEFTDNTASNQGNLFYEYQRNGDVVDAANSTYDGLPITSVPSWEGHRVEIQYNAANSYQLRAKLDGVDVTGWVSMQYSPNRMFMWTEHYNAGGNCDNQYGAITNTYWDFLTRLLSSIQLGDVRV